MKTRIAHQHRGRCIELLIDDGAAYDDRKVLAAMTLFEGTGAWMLTDLRLRKYKVPSAHSGSLNADVIHAHFEPENEEEAQTVRAMLREFTEDEEGIHWSTFDGLVPGKPYWHESDWMAEKNHIGYFTRGEGVAYLKGAQTWWDAFDGTSEPDLPNPKRQPSETEVRFRLRYPELTKRHEATAVNG